MAFEQTAFESKAFELMVHFELIVFAHSAQEEIDFDLLADW